MKETTYKQCNVPAAPLNGSSEVEFTLAGKYFLLRRATFPVSVKFDNDAEIDLEPGIILTREFSRVKVINRDSDNAATVGFYVSTDPINFFSPNIRLPDTYIVPDARTLPSLFSRAYAASSIPRAGQFAPDRRKSIEITNLHSSLYLTVSVSGTACSQIPPKSSKIYETTQTVSAYNTSTTLTMDIQVLETYYFTP